MRKRQKLYRRISNESYGFDRECLTVGAGRRSYLKNKDKIKSKLLDLKNDCPLLNYNFASAKPLDVYKWIHQNETNQCIEKSLCGKSHVYLKDPEECARKVKQVVEVSNGDNNLVKSLIEAATINFNKGMLERRYRQVETRVSGNFI